MDVEIRQARATDRDAVLSFCRRIWPERDYSELTWPGWLNDSGRVMLVAVTNKKPVGIIRGEMLSSREGWVEGVRIDPEYHSHGIGSRLLERTIPALREKGAEYLRSLIAIDNLASQRVFEKNGFGSPHLQRPFAIKRALSRIDLGAPPAELAKLGQSDRLQALRLLASGQGSRRRRAFLETTEGLYCCDGVRWRYWNEDHLTAHLEAGEVWVWSDPTPQAIAVVTTSPLRPGVWDVGLLEGSRLACCNLLAGLARREAMPSGNPDYPPSVRTFLPLALPRLQRAARDAGFTSDRVRHKAMFLWEWRADETTRVPAP